MEKKEPFVAVILSAVIPGAGQCYCGRWGRGVAFFFGVGLGTLLLFIPGVIVWLWNVIDAHTLAKATQK